MKKKLLIFLCSLPLFVSAQKIDHKIWGKITDSAGIVSNVTVINLKTKQGTYSNDDGNYIIYASLGDSLQFSSIQHKKEIRVLNKKHLISQKIDIYMRYNYEVLDPVIIKKNKLTGFLLSDLKKVPIDSRQVIVNKMMLTLGSMDMSNIPYGKDEIHLMKAGGKHADPTRAFKGVGLSFGIGNGKRKESKIDAIVKNKFTPKKVITYFGSSFFNDLKIPKNHHYRFIFFCENFGIKKLFEEEKILHLIKLFQEKSIVYLSTIKNE